MCLSNSVEERNELVCYGHQMSLVEISRWQNGNYSTAWIMFAWHLYHHWLCPCEEQRIDPSPKTKAQKRSGTEN